VQQQQQQLLLLVLVVLQPQVKTLACWWQLQGGLKGVVHHLEERVLLVMVLVVLPLQPQVEAGVR
jgi:hypothetical protein